MSKNISHTIESKIYLLRGQKVMLDADLAQLYQVPTHRLNEAVKRNLKRFPQDFMFRLTDAEHQNLISQFAISKSIWGGRRHPPYAFTEQGVSMLSSILKSDRAIAVNILIMRAFVQLRQMAANHKDLAEKIIKLEKDSEQHGQNIERVFDVLRQLIHQEEKPKRRMGFHVD